MKKKTFAVLSPYLIATVLKSQERKKKAMLCWGERKEEVGGRLESRGESKKRNWLSISSFGEGRRGEKERERRIRLSPCDRKRRRRRSQIEKTFLIPLSKGKKGKSRGGVKKSNYLSPVSLPPLLPAWKKRGIFFIPSSLLSFPISLFDKRAPC